MLLFEPRVFNPVAGISSPWISSLRVLFAGGIGITLRQLGTAWHSDVLSNLGTLLFVATV